jgi:hypothetical protein
MWTIRVADIGSGETAGGTIAGIKVTLVSATSAFAGAPSSDCDRDGVADDAAIASGSAEDCDDDGEVDVCAIERGATADANGNGEPDLCEHLRGDLDLDGLVDASDLAILLSNWARTDARIEDGDLDRDGVVGAADLAIMLEFVSGSPEAPQ